ncbi:hypothetical protein GIB67_031294 [Kingdonia uniflora]|uniref:Uncharacterized protein n=1 Tax=Kingdonia uniflora TaxID=39325 RepID=A0A7J7P603_9MAGN|nr:hypothetical protein GIB67_031294 [Kingdonia uniflora]
MFQNFQRLNFHRYPKFQHCQSLECQHCLSLHFHLSLKDQNFQNLNLHLCPSLKCQHSQSLNSHLCPSLKCQTSLSPS